MLEDIKKEARERMAKCVQTFQAESEEAAHRTGASEPDRAPEDRLLRLGRAAAAGREHRRGGRTYARRLPWEKTVVQAIEKAIFKSDLGLTPMTAGTVIRIPMPPLTEERRREITKVLRHDAESARVAVRNVRRDVMYDVKEMLKEKLVSQDDERRAEDEIQKLTDKYVAEIDQVLAAKEKEMMQV